MTLARPYDKIAAGLAFVLGLATILGALGSQFIGGLQPCELCLEQRLSYYWGLPLLLVVLVTWMFFSSTPASSPNEKRVLGASAAAVCSIQR